jgi:hypothetical protein
MIGPDLPGPAIVIFVEEYQYIVHSATFLLLH